MTGDKHDLIRICKKVMNTCNSKRLISKPEASVLLGQLDLTKCTETIENVSISNTVQLRKAESGGNNSTMVARYQKRSKEDENLSLHQFFHKVKNKGNSAKRGAIIPHFVGVNGRPTFPVTADYAKHQLIVHQPWRDYPRKRDWIAEFNFFINSEQAPDSAKMTYQRVHIRHLQGTEWHEPVAEVYDNTTNPIDMNDRELLELVGLHKIEGEAYDDLILKNMCRGHDFKWDNPPKPRQLSDSAKTTCPSQWLNKVCKEFEEKEREASGPGEMELCLPKKSDGTTYRLQDLYDDQLVVVLLVMDGLLEWATCDDLSSFQPLRLTLNGPAGTGKTVVINTIVTLIRQLFSEKNSVRVCAPTGTAAFNAGGETLHHLFENRAGMHTYDPFSMGAQKRINLIKKFQNLLCLIVDEQSLLDSTHLGITEQMMSETVFNGNMADHSWGNLPVVILVGDDYQLPSITDGAFDCLVKTSGNKITNSGRKVFKDCASTVLSLKTSKRIQDKQKDDKILLNKLRTATDLADDEVQRLLNLHIDNIRIKHGAREAANIEEKCIFLYYRNNKRVMKNLEMLIANSNSTNPVAVCKTHSEGLSGGKAIKSHFKGDIPSSALLCIGATCALENRNFQPLWGLHNGAVGTVNEIVFATGKDPNKSDLPNYVVVEFPLYSGPVWDINNPKVRSPCCPNKAHKFAISQIFSAPTACSNPNSNVQVRKEMLLSDLRST